MLKKKYCKICRGNNLDKIVAGGNLYYFCNNCGLIFLDSKEVLPAEEEIKRYELHDNSHENLGYVKMFRKFIKKVIKPYKDDIETVLEFGCGPGPVLGDLLKEEGFDVDIYDPFFFPEKGFERKSYDLITSTEVFEHFLDPLKEIELLIAHMNEKGYLAIMTSFHPGTDEFSDWFYIWDETHITFYNLNTFEWIAENYPLKLIYHDNNKYCLFQKE
ncbi:MAG: class I SAM-dependent methyltransferase [Halanaerobiales bacterium]